MSTSCTILFRTSNQYDGWLMHITPSCAPADWDKMQSLLALHPLHCRNAIFAHSTESPPNSLEAAVFSDKEILE